MIGEKRVFCHHEAMLYWEKNQIRMIEKKRVFCHHEASGLLDSTPRLIASEKGPTVLIHFSSSLCESALLTLSFLVTLAAVVPQFSEERLWKVHPAFESWQRRLVYYPLLLDPLEGA
jgi:hypothetical protein